MNKISFIFILLFALVSLADEKAETYFRSCRTSSLSVLLNIIKDAKREYKKIDAFSLEKCSALRDIRTKFNTWDAIKNEKLEGCTAGVDTALGMNPKDDMLRKKFKMELCM